MYRNIFLSVFLLLSLILSGQKENNYRHSVKLLVSAPLDLSITLEESYSIHGMGIGGAYNFQYRLSDLPLGFNLRAQLMRNELPTPTTGFQNNGNSYEIVAHPSGSIFCGALFAGLFLHAEMDPGSIAFQPSISIGYAFAHLNSKLGLGVKTPNTTLSARGSASNICMLVGADFVIPVNKKVQLILGGQLDLMTYTFDGIRSSLASETLNYNNWSISIGFSGAFGGT